MIEKECLRIHFNGRGHESALWRRQSLPYVTMLQFVLSRVRIRPGWNLSIELLGHDSPQKLTNERADRGIYISTGKITITYKCTYIQVE